MVGIFFGIILPADQIFEIGINYSINSLHWQWSHLQLRKNSPLRNLTIYNQPMHQHFGNILSVSTLSTKPNCDSPKEYVSGLVNCWLPHLHKSKFHSISGSCQVLYISGESLSVMPRFVTVYSFIFTPLSMGKFQTIFLS